MSDDNNNNNPPIETMTIEEIKARSRGLADIFWAAAAQKLSTISAKQKSDFQDQGGFEFRITYSAAKDNQYGVDLTFGEDNGSDVYMYTRLGGDNKHLEGFKQFHEACKKKNFCILPVKDEPITKEAMENYSDPIDLFKRYLATEFNVKLHEKVYKVSTDLPYSRSKDANFWMKP